MPIELVIGLAAILVWRILAGMKIPVISTLLRGIWNLCFTVSSFIPFFGWAAHFIIADTKAEKKSKDEMIQVGKTMDSMVSGAFGGGSSGGYQTGDVVHSNGQTYRVRREGHLVYLCGEDGSERVVDTDFADIDGKDGFTYDGVRYTK